ncbi:MAG: GNAT family N-acetyltransferase [Pseudomonadota bacterium]
MMRNITFVFVLQLLFAIAPSADAQSKYPFVDEAYEVPDELTTDSYRLRVLTVHDVIKDFDAVMASAEQLKEIFPGWGGWPDGLTLEEDLIDLAWHQREFTRRSSFTYTVISLDETTVLGCVYIYPTRKSGYDADIKLWARASEQGGTADAELEQRIRAWIAADWPFENPAYPGRDMSWEEWDAHPTSKR